MALVTLNDVPASEATITLPRIGIWHVDLVLAASSGLDVGDSATVSIGSDALQLSGTVKRVSAFLDALQVRVVAGGAGMNTTATPKNYRSALVRSVVSDLLDTAGEQLDASADASVLSTVLSAWQTLARPVWIELGNLLGLVSPGSAYRLTAGGKLWIGTDSYAETTAALELHERDELTGRLVFGCELPILQPGEAVDGDSIGDVEHTVTGRTVRTVAWIER